MSAELGSNLPPEITAFIQKKAEVIRGLQKLSRTVPKLSINLPFQQLPERVRQLLVLADVPQESNSQIDYYYAGDPDEMTVLLHGRYSASTFRFNWFPPHPESIAQLTIVPRLRKLGDSSFYPSNLIGIQPRLTGGGYGNLSPDAKVEWENLQEVVSDAALGSYHLQLLRDLTSFTKHCADILSGNILKP